MSWFLILFFGFVTTIVVLLLLGAFVLRRESKVLHKRLLGAARGITDGPFDTKLLKEAPEPVRRYFEAVLQPGQPIIERVMVEHTGSFNLGKGDEGWRPFTSTQHFVTNRCGFDWAAKIKVAPGFTARVHDAYIAGEGLLHASLFGIITLAKAKGTPDMAQGELMRYLAEAAWFPTALLPSQGITWEGIDPHTAKATLTDGDVTATLTFTFSPETGLMERVRSEARGRMVGEDIIPTVWEGKWLRHERHGGMLIPVEGEVAWVTPYGPLPYWRGTITKITYTPKLPS